MSEKGEGREGWPHWFCPKHGFHYAPATADPPLCAICSSVLQEDRFVPLSRATQAEAELAKYEQATEIGIERIRAAYRARPRVDTEDYDYERWMEYTLHARTEERDWHRVMRAQAERERDELREAVAEFAAKMDRLPVYPRALDKLRALLPEDSP
jgi:hypothetical protein